MNKSGRLNYFSKYEDALIVASSEVKGVHVLPLGVNSLSEQLQRILKAIKFRRGDNKKNKNYPSSISMK